VQQPRLVLNHGAIGTKMEMPPALDSAVVDLELAAGLAAGRADAPAAAQPHAHDHRVGGKADVNTDAPGKRSNRLNAVVTRTSPSSKSS
jgi:hypothetical protein